MEAAQASHFGWNRAPECVLLKIQGLEAVEISQFRWNRTIQSVPVEIQCPKAPQRAQLGRYRAAEGIARKVESLEALQVFQGGWNETLQTVPRHVQPRDPAHKVHLHAVPSAERAVAQPVLRVDPVRTAGLRVERDEGSGHRHVDDDLRRPLRTALDAGQCGRDLDRPLSGRRDAPFRIHRCHRGVAP